MGEPTEKAKDQLSRGQDKKFLCGVAVNVYQNSGEPADSAGLLRAPCQTLQGQQVPDSSTGVVGCGLVKQIWHTRAPKAFTALTLQLPWCATAHLGV